MSCLIIAEHDNITLSPNIRNLALAASKTGKPLHVLIIGSGNTLQSVADAAAKVSGVEKVFLSNNKIYEAHLAESLAPAIKELSKDYSHIFAPATTFGKDFMPRLAALLDIQQISEIIEVLDENTFKRHIYAGNAITTVKSLENKKIITVRIAAFEKTQEEGNAVIENITLPSENNLSKFISLQRTESARPELTSARIVISGGRGVGSMDNFKIIEKLADKLKAAIGASRAAVDAGYVPNDYQVGQTGKIIAPDLYIAVGISGAIQHLAGMKDSKTIVAINKDENAPIFEIADIGLVGDLFQIIPELEQKI